MLSNKDLHTTRVLPSNYSVNRYVSPEKLARIEDLLTVLRAGAHPDSESSKQLILLEKLNKAFNESLAYDKHGIKDKHGSFFNQQLAALIKHLVQELGEGVNLKNPNNEQLERIKEILRTQAASVPNQQLSEKQKKITTQAINALDASIQRNHAIANNFNKTHELQNMAYQDIAREEEELRPNVPDYDNELHLKRYLDKLTAKTPKRDEYERSLVNEMAKPVNRESLRQYENPYEEQVIKQFYKQASKEGKKAIDKLILQDRLAGRLYSNPYDIRRTELLEKLMKNANNLALQAKSDNYNRALAIDAQRRQNLAMLKESSLADRQHKLAEMKHFGEQKHHWLDKKYANELAKEEARVAYGKERSALERAKQLLAQEIATAGLTQKSEARADHYVSTGPKGPGDAPLQSSTDRAPISGSQPVTHTHVPGQTFRPGAMDAATSLLDIFKNI